MKYSSLLEYFNEVYKISETPRVIQNLQELHEIFIESMRHSKRLEYFYGVNEMHKKSIDFFQVHELFKIHEISQKFRQDR